jgi:UDPglucose 6-dehydrogenase
MASKFLESTRTNYEHNNIQFVYSPEFIALGNVVDNLLKPQFCLIGSDARILDSNNWGAELAIDIKTKVTSNSRPIHSVTFESAEIAKISCNTFLTTKITYANLIQQIVEKVPGAKSIEVFSVLHSDDRIGSKFFSPGLGYGGPCLPRDNQALGGLLDSFSIPSQIPYATHDFNESLVESIMANKNLNNLTDRDTVLILGLAYKTGTSSTIESHSLKIAANLASKGIKVRAHDFQVDFSSTELNFLEYTSNKLDKELIGKSVIVILAQYDQMYRDFVINQIDKNIDCIDPWNMLTNVR